MNDTTETITALDRRRATAVADAIGGRRARCCAAGSACSAIGGERSEDGRHYQCVVPGITFVEPPCQVSVQPPAWLPMLSAFEPAT